MATEMTAAGVITGSLEGFTSVSSLDQVTSESLEEQTTIASTSVAPEGAQTGPVFETSESTTGSLEGVGAATETTEASYLPVGTSSLGPTSTVVLTSTALGSTATVFTTLPLTSATPRYSSSIAIGAIVGIVIVTIVVAVLLGLFIFRWLKRRRRQDRPPTIVPSNSADEPEMEQQDLPVGQLRHFDERPTTDSDNEAPPTFNSY
jgi:hypothetical protein